MSDGKDPEEEVEQEPVVSEEPPEEFSGLADDETDTSFQEAGGFLDEEVPSSEPVNYRCPLPAPGPTDSDFSETDEGSLKDSHVVMGLIVLVVVVIVIVVLVIFKPKSKTITTQNPATVDPPKSKASYPVLLDDPIELVIRRSGDWADPTSFRLTEREKTRQKLEDLSEISSNNSCRIDGMETQLDKLNFVLEHFPAIEEGEEKNTDRR